MRAHEFIFEENIQDVYAKYHGTEKWMKAPNGEPTKLNRMQWLQTRSAEFKKWFGDFENSPNSASKVVDENGDPMVVYHGSPLEFSEFLKNSWFTTDPNDSKTYSTMRVPDREYQPQTYPVFLNIRNPKYIDWYILKSEAHDILDKLKRDSGFIIDQHGRKHFVIKNPTQIKSAIGNSGKFSKSPNITESVDIPDILNGRPTRNSQGKLIHPTKDELDVTINNICVRLDYRHKDIGLEWVTESKKPSNIYYHGTTASFDTFSKGDIGFHVGTQSQARSRAGRGKDSKVLKVKVSFSNPLKIDEDFGSWKADSDTFTKLHERGAITDEQYQGWYTKRTGLYSDYYRGYTSRASTYLRKVLMANGYDCIMYTNWYEDAQGKPSLILFKPEQLVILREHITESIDIPEMIDGRPTRNSQGKLIHPTIVGISRS